MVRIILNKSINHIKFDTIVATKVKWWTLFLKVSIFITKTILYWTVLAWIVIFSLLMSFSTYSLFYHYTMPTEVQRQQLQFQSFNNSLVAEISMNWDIVDNGIMPPSDWIYLEPQKYMSFLELDILETDSNFEVHSVYTHTRI